MIKKEIAKIGKYISDKDYRFWINTKIGIYNHYSDEKFIREKYRIRFGRIINLNKPCTFNEKLQWLKLNDHRPEYVEMVDKYLAKKYVSKIIGGEYIIPTYGVWDHFDEIDFSGLPDQFALKCTHDSGGVVLCNNKSSLKVIEAKKKIEKSLKRNFYLIGREWPYKKVHPRIIAEKLLIEATGDVKDYKFFCFSGKVRFFKIDFNRFVDHHANYYDLNYDRMNLGETICPPDPSYKLVIPDNIEEMIFLSEKLAKNLPFVRVDLYSVNNRIYFGELTLYPASGFGTFIDEKWDAILGSYLSI